MAFDFAGKEMGVKHNGAQSSLREEFQGHHPSQGEGSGPLRISRHLLRIPGHKSELKSRAQMAIARGQFTCH
jgi:hypothetical protein